MMFKGPVPGGDKDFARFGHEHETSLTCCFLKLEAKNKFGFDLLHFRSLLLSWLDWIEPG